MKVGFVFVAAAITVVAPAFADDYSKFYQPAPRGSVALLPSATPPEIVQSTGDAQADVTRMWQQGFALIGYSAFNGKLHDPAKALKFGLTLKARYVVVATGGVSERTSAIPLTMPTSNTSQTFGNVAVSGGLGSANGTFNATTTTTGSQTTYIPFTVRRADQAAAYFGPVERRGSGVFAKPLTDSEKAQLGTNRGIRVLAVRDGSPAYNADIVPGDIILAVNDQPLALDAWNAAMAAPTGTKIKVSLQRQNAPRDVIVTIPPGWN